MKQITTIAKITATKKLNNSVNGNPAYEVRLETANNVMYGRTAPDAMCAYVLNLEYTYNAEVTYHLTRSGKLYIDYIIRTNQ